MALIWPVTLPQYPLSQGLAWNYLDNTVSSRTDVGPGKTRKRYSDSRKSLVCSILLDATQVNILEDFYQNVTQAGVLTFGWSNLTDITGDFLWGFQNQAPPRLNFLVTDRWAANLSLVSRLQSEP